MCADTSLALGLHGQEKIDVKEFIVLVKETDHKLPIPDLSDDFSEKAATRYGIQKEPCKRGWESIVLL